MTGKFVFCICLFICVFCVFVIAAALIINKRHNENTQRKLNEMYSIERTGLFREIFEAYRHDDFEFNLNYDKLLHEEYDNNTIDIGLIKNKHEFFILLTEDYISIIADEETNHPIEREIPLSDIPTMEQVYLLLNEFIENNS